MENCTGKTCGRSSCLIAWTSVNYIGGQQSFWELCSRRNTASLDRRGWRWAEMKEGCKTSKILHNWPMELFGCEHASLLKKREEWHQEGSEICRMPLPPCAEVHRPRGRGCVCLSFIGQWHILGFRSASSSQDQGLELPPMAEWSGTLTILRCQSHHTGRPGKQSIEPKIILEPKTLN